MDEGGTVNDRVSFPKSPRAVREFRDEPVPREVVDDVPGVARLSGSAPNRQPGKTVVVRERTTLDALADVEGYASHPAGAPLGIVSAGEREDYDGGSMCGRIMLAARAPGVGSGVGRFVRGGRDGAKVLRSVPSGRTARTVVSAGYSDEESRRGESRRGESRRGRGVPSRRPLSEVVHEERCG